MMNADDRTIPLTLTLRYAHPLGELAPYFQGLDAGRAIATRCPTCARTWFPPRLSCPEHGAATVWTDLSGKGRIVSVSISFRSRKPGYAGKGRIVSVSIADSTLPFGAETARRAFLMVALDGAENLAFGRFAGAPDAARAGLKVRLARAPGTWPHPAQAAWFVADE